MRQLRLVPFILTAVFSIGALGETPRVKRVGCNFHGDRVTIGGASAKLSTQINRNHLNAACNLITYGDRIFISVQYNGLEYVTYSLKVRGVRMNDVYRLSDGRLTLKFSDPVEALKATWLEFNGHLVMRNMEKGHGADGYVYLVDSDKFVDFGQFATDNKWPID